MCEKYDFLAYIGQYEYKFDNLDWYLKIQTQIWINSTQNNYMLTKLNAIKVCKLLYTGAAPDARLFSHSVRFQKEVLF